MAKPLVIVESPAKARTIAKFLGSDFVVESSIGHIRDLPRAAAEIPAAYKGESWARLGVDTDNDFKPLYVVAKEKRDQVRKLKDLLKDADELYLATDEDREGESIAWHLLEVLSPRVPVKRMVFHEITEKAIREAVTATRELDRRLVDAQETRRILDRLYGYEISPVLWRKILPKLSAGRVQSVACRVIVDRERARMAFSEATYYDLVARLAKGDDSFDARLVSLDGRRIAGSRDFHSLGHLEERAEKAQVLVVDEKLADGLVNALSSAEFVVQGTETKPYRRSPAPPFMTSTLQQEAGRKLRFSSQRTMSVAQRLYENGYITYMRTDSISLSESAIQSSRAIAHRLYGKDSTPDTPRLYRSKVKNAQEAHEAIRPAGENWKSPEEVQRELGGDEARLYELVWKRAVASQMSDALGSTMTVRVSTALTALVESSQ
ncbi:MAG: type I DNA topoisomerase, partial [Acidimicrobiales bacterium]